MADLYGPAFGIGQMGLAVGDRYLAERDRDRAISVQDRAFGLQKNQDARAQSMSDAELAEIKRRNDAEDAQTLAGTPMAAGAPGAQGAAVPSTQQGSNIPAGSFDFQIGLHPNDDPAQKNAMDLAEPADASFGQGSGMGHSGGGGTAFATPQSGGRASAKTQAPGAGAPAAAGSAQVTPKIKFNFLQNAQSTMDDANALLAQARSHESEMNQRLAANPFGDASDPSNRKAQLYAKGIDDHYQQKIQSALQGAYQKRADAETLRFGNYSSAAAAAIRAGNPAKATEYLQATGMPPEAAAMYGNLKWDKTSKKWAGKNGYEMTDETLDAMVNARDPESIRKSLEHTLDYDSKLREAQAKVDAAKTSAGAAFAPSPNERMLAQLNQLDQQRTQMDAQGVPADDPRRKVLESTAYNLRNTLPIAGAETKSQTNVTKEDVARIAAEARVLGANQMGLGAAPLGASFGDAAQNIRGFFGGNRGPATPAFTQPGQATPAAPPIQPPTQPGAARVAPETAGKNPRFPNTVWISNGPKGSGWYDPTARKRVE